MKIHIHRGQNQIGGSVIEITSKTQRIFFDIGANMDDPGASEIPDVKGLFSGKRDCDAVFISHYHADHMGLIAKLLPGIPVYMGETAFAIWKAAESYKNHVVSFQPQFVRDREPVRIGEMVITPYQCDHSAYDSYMYLIEADGESVLYTGDFRGHGRRDFDALLQILPHAETLITEGTSLSRDVVRPAVREDDLVEMASEYLQNISGPVFILMSPMNVDRLITAYRIAQNTGRLFLEDRYAAVIAGAVGEAAPRPGTDAGIRLFSPEGELFAGLFGPFRKNRIGIRGIAKEKVVMCVRPAMRNYLEQLSNRISFQDGVLIYSMFDGHLEKPSFSKFMDFMKKKGAEVVTFHTSGHADPETIDRLIQTVKPDTIIPVHTEQAEWFLKYKDTCKIVLENKES